MGYKHFWVWIGLSIGLFFTTRVFGADVVVCYKHTMNLSDLAAVLAKEIETLGYTTAFKSIGQCNNVSDMWRQGTKAMIRLDITAGEAQVLAFDSQKRRIVKRVSPLSAQVLTAMDQAALNISELLRAAFVELMTLPVVTEQPIQLGETASEASFDKTSSGSEETTDDATLSMNSASNDSPLFGSVPKIASVQGDGNESSSQAQTQAETPKSQANVEEENGAADGDERSESESSHPENANDSEKRIGTLEQSIGNRQRTELGLKAAVTSMALSHPPSAHIVLEGHRQLWRMLGIEAGLWGALSPVLIKESEGDVAVRKTLLYLGLRGTFLKNARVHIAVGVGGGLDLSIVSGRPDGQWNGHSKAVPSAVVLGQLHMQVDMTRRIALLAGITAGSGVPKVIVKVAGRQVANVSNLLLSVALGIQIRLG